MASSETVQLEFVNQWLVKIAENTARIRDALTGSGGGTAGAAAGGGAAAVARAEGKQEAQFSRLGQFIQTALAVQVGTRLGQAQSLGNRGFGGTAEAATQDYYMEQLSRQFAAVMRPVFQGFTYAAAEIERRLKGMGGGEQTRLLGAGIGGLAGMRYGGLPGALAGMGLGAIALGQPAPYDRYVGMAAGAYLGGRFGGLPGAAAGLAAGEVFASGDYGRARARGAGEVRAGTEAVTNSWAFSAVLPSAAMSLYRGITGRGPGFALTDVARARPEEPRREVTPFMSQMEEAGASYMRLQEATIRATAGGDFAAEAGPFKDVVDAIMLIFDLLRGVLTGGPIPPAPAGR